MKLMLIALFAMICAPAFADTVVADCQGYVLKTNVAERNFTVTYKGVIYPTESYTCSLGDPLIDIECYRGGVGSAYLDIVRTITWNKKHTKVIHDEMHGLLDLGTDIASLDCKQN